VDIFLSYAREDEARVAGLVDAFVREGWTVFWDRHIPAGESWRSHIGRALQNARCVVVAWSQHAIESQWVVEEADEGNARSALVPVLLDPVLPPRGFRAIQAADLSGWTPGEPSERLEQLLADLRRRLGASAAGAPGAPAPAPAPAPAQAALPQPIPVATARSSPAPAPGGRRGLLWAGGAAALLLVGGGAVWFLRVPQTGGTVVQPRTDAQPIEPDPRVRTRPPPAASAWLVIAGSYARAEAATAERRRVALAASGVEAVRLASDDFPLLAPGLVIVALGPFDSRDAAHAALSRLKPLVPDAYVKQGR
jgi:hypothetical protein